jgi:F-type H+-transporting ATPase subunit delta
MDEGKISIRYAKAFYSLAEEKNAEHELYQLFDQLSRAFFEIPELGKSISNPMIEKNVKLSLLLMASNGSSLPLASDIFQFIMDKGREDLTHFIAMSYMKLYREKQRLVTGTIHSALPLPENTILKIRELVNSRFQASIELNIQVSPQLLGGFVLEVDNYRMDSSLYTALENVRTELIQS